MRKQVLAFLSALGLAGSSAPATAQVLKGSTPADTKSESTVKASKVSQEDAASKDAGKTTKLAKEQKASDGAADKKIKYSKSKNNVSSVEGGHATSDAVKDKWKKAGAEQKAAGLDDKRKRTTAEDNSLKTTTEDKARKVSTENAASGGHIKKGLKNEAEAQAAQKDANKKTDQASPK